MPETGSTILVWIRTILTSSASNASSCGVPPDGRRAHKAAMLLGRDDERSGDRCTCSTGHGPRRAGQSSSEASPGIGKTALLIDARERASTCTF